MENKKFFYKIFVESFDKLFAIIEENSSKIKNLKREDSIENLHKTRVSFRRLRVLLSLYKAAFKLKDDFNLIKKIKKIGKVLGKARELDVQIKFLESFSGKVKKESYLKGIYSILKYLKKKRNKKQQKVLDKIEKIKQIKKKIDKIRSFSYKNLKIEFVKQVILKKIDKFLSLTQNIYDSENVKKLHKIRIVAKTIRYQLEILKPYYKNEVFNKGIEIFHSIQDFIGDIHDIDVFNETLIYLIKNKPHVKDTAKFLLEKTNAERKNKYRKLLSFWNDFRNREVIFKLNEVI